MSNIVAGFGGFVELRPVASTSNLLSMQATRWTVEWRVDAIDTSCLRNHGWGIYTPGVTDFDVSVDCIFDTTDDPFTSGGSLSLGAGSTFRAKLSLSEAHASLFFDFPRVLLMDVRVDDSIRDVIRYSLRGRANHTVAADESGLVVPLTT